MLGEEKEYYLIEMLGAGGTLMTPVAKADEIGLRPAIDDETVRALLRSFSDQPTTLSQDFRERQVDIEDRLKDGDIFVSAAVIRDLAWYRKDQGLTKRDAQLMQRAEELVAGELALVEDIDLKDALLQVQTAMELVVSEQEEA
jgi:CarD family transcriptional regulator